MRDHLPVSPPEVPAVASVDLGVDLWAVARASGPGVTAKQVRRAMERLGADRTGGGGAVMTVSLSDEEFALVSSASAADVAVATARMLGLGVYAARRRARALRALSPSPKPKEPRVRAQTHPWKRGDRGRSIRAVEGGNHIATLTCRCGGSNDIRFRALAASDQIDRKFIQQGWRLDPPMCPSCQPQRETKTLSAANPSPAAIRSQAAMFRLLGQHFDVDSGRYAEGWSDARIAKDTGVSAAMVAGIRDEAFGPIKEPEEVAALARDIETLDGMLIEAAATVETIKTDLASLKERLAELRRRFAA